jgi:hypothetical protein
VHSFVLSRLSFKACLLAVITAIPAFPAFAAPSQLYNKTIHMSWSNLVSETGPSGEKKSVTVAINHTVYVSSTGRLFERASRSAGRMQKGSDMAPGDALNKGGEATNVHFEGNRLVGLLAFAQGGRRYVASFDPGFASCTLAVTIGREAGGMKRKGINGVMYTLDSVTPSGESCSISEGNSFAQ